MYKQTITDSDCIYGDVTINFCDPDFCHPFDQSPIQSKYHHTLRIIAYALFAEHLIIPSRYLLQHCDTFGIVSAAPELLREGVVVPDLRMGESCFTDYVHRNRDASPERIACARFLDENSSHFFSFNIKDQSELYHRHLVEDVAPGGAFFRMRGANREDLFQKISDEFKSREGSRRTFVELATSYVPELEDEWRRWAALRYYLTPGEIEHRLTRDLPFAASQLIAEAGLQLEAPYFEDPSMRNDIPEPMHTAFSDIQLYLPSINCDMDIGNLSNAVLETRRETEAARKKFASVLEKSHAEEAVGAINESFRKAMAREKGFSDRVRIQMKPSMGKRTLMFAIDLVAGFIIPSAAQTTINLGIGLLKDRVSSWKENEATPFISATENLRNRLASEEGEDLVRVA